MAGDTEVLKQHIAGENIGGGKLANGVTVLLHRIAQRLAVHTLQPDIQRHHSAFDVEMADSNFIAHIDDFIRYFSQ